MPRTPNRFPTHGSELRALLAECHREPDDDTPRLVLADWLEEHDDPRGELMRLQCQINAVPAGDPEYDRLFEQHQKCWKKNARLWQKEIGSPIWNDDPRERGLPTLGHYEGDDRWLQVDDLNDPAKKPKDRLSATIAAGWPGMTWVFASDPFAEDWDDFDEDEMDDVPLAGDRPGFDAFAGFERPPWTGSPTPIGICFPSELLVTEEVIDRVAKIPNVRGLALMDTEANARLLPRIAKIKSPEHLDLDTLRLNDDGLKTLAPLKNLRTLIALFSSITNQGANTLAKFTELRELRLGARRLTAAGYEAIARLSKLEALQLEKADDAAIRHLAPLTRLRRLYLGGTNVTGRGIENFPLLTDLNLEGTQVEANLACLAGLKRLRRLNISEIQITGTALSHLSGLRWLEELDAGSTNLRDKDLVHLEPLTNLSRLNVIQSRITDAGAEKLTKKLKKLVIFH